MSDKQYHDFFSLYVVVFSFPKDYSGSEKEVSMNQKQIGLFLKELRKQKGLTQRQLAEILGVSDRSVSRWESGNNMPDLSILVELADYYEIDIREIIDGERKGENIIICAITIVTQLLISSNITMVIGETIIMMIGGMAYLLRLVRSGAFDNPVKNSKANYARISSICAGVFSIFIFLFMYMNGENLDLAKIIFLTLLFFVVIMIVGRIVLSLLGRASDKNAEKDKYNR